RFSRDWSSDVCSSDLLRLFLQAPLAQVLLLALQLRVQPLSLQQLVFRAAQGALRVTDRGLGRQLLLPALLPALLPGLGRLPRGLDRKSVVQGERVSPL